MKTDIFQHLEICRRSALPNTVIEIAKHRIPFIEDHHFFIFGKRNSVKTRSSHEV